MVNTSNSALRQYVQFSLFKTCHIWILHIFISHRLRMVTSSVLWRFSRLPPSLTAKVRRLHSRGNPASSRPLVSYSRRLDTMDIAFFSYPARQLTTSYSLETQVLQPEHGTQTIDFRNPLSHIPLPEMDCPTLPPKSHSVEGLIAPDDSITNPYLSPSSLPWVSRSRPCSAPDVTSKADQFRSKHVHPPTRRGTTHEQKQALDHAEKLREELHICKLKLMGICEPDSCILGTKHEPVYRVYVQQLEAQLEVAQRNVRAVCGTVGERVLERSGSRSTSSLSLTSDHLATLAEAQNDHGPRLWQGLWHFGQQAASDTWSTASQSSLMTDEDHDTDDASDETSVFTDSSSDDFPMHHYQHNTQYTEARFQNDPRAQIDRVSIDRVSTDWDEAAKIAQWRRNLRERHSKAMAEMAEEKARLVKQLQRRRRGGVFCFGA